VGEDAAERALADRDAQAAGEFGQGGVGVGGDESGEALPASGVEARDWSAGVGARHQRAAGPVALEQAAIQEVLTWNCSAISGRLRTPSSQVAATRSRRSNEKVRMAELLSAASLPARSCACYTRSQADLTVASLIISSFH